MMASFALPVLAGVLVVATFTDLRTRRVPTWLTFSAVVGGVAASAAAGGPAAIVASLLGIAVGGGALLPLVLMGGVGAADALLLAAVGAWLGWHLALWTLWWTALVGAALAVVAWWRGHRAFPYVPAIAAGLALASLTA